MSTGINYLPSFVQKYRPFQGIAFISILVNLFPWISFSLNTFDMQPWVIFFNLLIILILFKRKIHNYVFWSYLLFIPVFVVAIMDVSESTPRGLASYFILFLGVHFFYLVYSCYMDQFVRAIFFANLIWIFFGLFQYFFGLDTLDGLVNLRSSADRGFTSLAPEPTHFGFHLVFFSWIILLLKYRMNVLVRHMFVLLLANILSIFLLAQSSMAVLYLLILVPGFIISIGLSNKNFFILLVASPLLLIVFYFLSTINELGRMTNLVEMVIENPMLVIEQDASINARFSHLFLSIYGAIVDGLIPHGFQSFSDHSYLLNEMSGNFFWYNYQSNLIMSGLGSLVYEVGVIGLFFLLLTLYFMMGWQGFSFFGFSSFCMLWLFMAGAIPISYPLLPAVIVMVYFSVARRGVRFPR